MTVDERRKASIAADARIRSLVPDAIERCSASLLPLTGEERKRVAKALKKRGLL